MKAYDPLAAYNTKPIEQPSLVKRFLAFLLDFSLLSITVFAPLAAVLEKLAPSANFSATYAAFTGNESTGAVITIIMVFVFTLVMLYFVLLEYLLGQTAGMLFIGLKVEGNEGKIPTFWQCFVRNLVFLPLFPFIVFWIVDPLYLVFTKQRLSEQLSKTRTVNANYIKQQAVNI
ncbi:MAG: RDD family protein [Nanoarchaeota archaeon]